MTDADRSRRLPRLVGYQPRCGYCGQPRELRRRCQACRRLIFALKTQAKHSILVDRVRSTLRGTMAGKKSLTDAFRLNASDKPIRARWPSFNFKAFFANLDQQAQGAKAVDTSEIPHSYIVCSQCQEKKLRAHFSKTQLHKLSQKRKCTECTKLATDDNISQSRYQGGKVTSKSSQSQKDRLPPTREPITVSGYISCSHCQHGKLRIQFSRTQLDRPSLKRRCIQCTTCETEPTKESKSQLARPRSRLLQTQVDEHASNEDCIQQQGKTWASGVLTITEP